MAVDIVPGLYDSLESIFQKTLSGDKTAEAMLKKINSGTAKYSDAGYYADKVGSAMNKAFKSTLSSSTLPDGRMYWNIAERTIEPLYRESYSLISKAATDVQQALNTAAGIGLKAQTAQYDENVTRTIMNELCAADNYDDVAYKLYESADMYTRSVVDDTLKENVDFQGKTGRQPKVIRTAGYKCCEWCADKEGVFSYPNVPEDVYRRHDNCRCDVEYDPGTGDKTQNVHTKQWTTSEERAKIEERKNFSGLNSKVNKEQLKSFGLAAGQDYGGIEAHDEPILLGTVNPEDRNAIMEVLEKYEKEIADSEIENAVVVTKSGDIIQCFGNTENVWVDKDLGDRLYGAYVTHNHPALSSNEYSFSDNDIQLFNEYNLQVLRGIDEKYGYELSRISDEIDEHATLYDLINSDGDLARNEKLIDYANRLDVGYRRWER